jgi:undecaprenyl-diphosphatase
VIRRAQPFLFVAAASLVTSLVTTAIKYPVGRERPASVVLDPEPLMEVPTTSSFPSGHAMSSFACAYVLARLAPRLAVPSFVLAALIAFSRVYVGVHYPLDIAAGAVLGVAVATALLMLLRALRRSPRAPRAD